MTKSNRPPPGQHQHYEDHSVIVPHHPLRTAVMRTAEPGDIAMDVVERAEAALAALKGEFSGWMRAECDHLESARQSLHEIGPAKATLDMLFRAAHDIRGDATTLGFPLAGQLAASLCRLIYYTPDPGRVPLPLIDHIVASIRAIVRENARDLHDPRGIEIAEELARLVEHFLAGELKDGYPEIAADAAPPLSVPTD